MSINSSKETIVVLLHSNYLINNAGIEKVVLEQQNLFMDLDLNFVAIFPIIIVRKIKGRHLYINTGMFKLIINGKENGEYRFEEISDLLGSINIKGLLIHQLIGYKRNDTLINFIKMFNCPIFYYIHDYGTICSNHALLKNNKKFCGTDGVNFKKCFNCRFYLPSIRRIKFYNKLFVECKSIRFVFPSEFIKSIWLSIYGSEFEKKCHVIPNQKFSTEINNISRNKTLEKIKIAYIGYQNRVKGWDTWKKVANINHDVYEPYILGRCQEKLKNVKEVNVSFIENGPNAMVEAIKNNEIDIAFLWSTRPETYGYTFYESYIGGTFIITNKDSGNIAEMVKRLNCGISFDSEEELINYLNNPERLKNDLNRNLQKYPSRPIEVVTNDEIFKLIEKYSNLTIEI
jgi:hypothetical protein